MLQVEKRLPTCEALNGSTPTTHHVKQLLSFTFPPPSLYSTRALQNLKAAMAAERAKGFSHVVVTSNLRDGFSLLIQSAGLGGMKHNTVLMAWPAGWTEARDPSARRNFIGKHDTQERLEGIVRHNKIKADNAPV